MLVLFAVSGAGLAVAADRQHGVTRPELFWEAEVRYGRMIDSAWAQVNAANEAAARVSASGRDALGSLQSLDAPAADAFLDDGDAVLPSLADLESNVAASGGGSFASMEHWRLSPERQAQVRAIDAAVVAARRVPGEWPPLASTGRTMSQALQALQRHDGLVLRVTTAGRQSEWEVALELLGQASAELDAARTARDALGEQGGVETLTDVIDRNSRYDAALASLYTYGRDGGPREGAELTRLQTAADQAQRALPGTDDALAAIVGESGAPELTAALLRLEHARGEINAALELAPTLRPEPTP